MGIEFTTVVVWSQVDPRLVDETHDLNVIGRLENLYAVERTVWNKACTVTWFRAPGDFLSLGRTNGRVWFRRCPQAEVWLSVSHQVAHVAHHSRDTNRQYG